MNGGIDQLVNTYKGNPQPLAQKVQQAQQGQPPGVIPPDLEEAIALQKISELRNSAQGQQAMQAGGAQPSVVEKLRQMLGNMQQQGQMQGQPVMAASGGSIDQLMSNLGQYYAGGGIVAFQSAGQVKDPNAEEDTSSQFVRDIAQLPGAFDAMKQRAREEDAARAAQDARMAQRKREVSEAKQKTSFFNYLFGSPQSEKEGLAKLTELSNAPLDKAPSAPATSLSDIRSQLNKADAARFAEKPDVPAAKVPAPTGNVPAAPRPTANVAVPATPVKPDVVEPTDPLEVALRKTIMETMGKDPEEVRRKAIEANKQAMGLDALLKPAQDRLTKREAMIEQIKASRQPLWITALQNAGNKPGNVAQVLNQMATGTSAAKQGYDTQDLKFLDELNDLYAGIDKAKIEGRYKDVAAGEAEVRNLIADKRQAEQSGTSLLNTKENVRSREQIAKEGRLSREQTASLAAQARRDALTDKTDNAYREQAMKLAMAAALKEKQLPANMVRYKDISAEQLAASMYDRIYNALKSGKMGTAPSAESPSGTPADINALLKKYGG
jgi:hypothetical protein